MALIGMRDVCWGLGGTPLIENVNFQIEKGERVGLVGIDATGVTSGNCRVDARAALIG